MEFILAHPTKSQMKFHWSSGQIIYCTHYLKLSNSVIHKLL